MTYTCDWPLFLALNFDGGPAMDGFMKCVSAMWTWLPFYLLMLWLVWRRVGLRAMLCFVAAAVLAVVLSDMVAGIFKHAGLLKNLWPSFPPRLRPMFTEELAGQIHIPYPGGGLYGTVSAHAATDAAIALLASAVIRRRWFSWTAAAWFLLVAYSRIYLAKHFPIDLLLGAVTGATVGGALYGVWLQAVKRWRGEAGGRKEPPIAK